MPTILRSRLMKIMSKGIGVFFIQKDCWDSAGNRKIMPRSAAKIAAILKPHLAFRRRVGDLNLKSRHRARSWSKSSLLGSAWQARHAMHQGDEEPND